MRLPTRKPGYVHWIACDHYSKAEYTRCPICHPERCENCGKPWLEHSLFGGCPVVDTTMEDSDAH